MIEVSAGEIDGLKQRAGFCASLLKLHAARLQLHS